MRLPREGEGEEEGTEPLLASPALFAPGCSPPRVLRAALRARCCPPGRAARWGGKADLALRLLPGGCRAIGSFWESVLNFWGGRTAPTAARREGGSRLGSCAPRSGCLVPLPSDGLWRLAGYERYNAMRADPALCFLEKVGMPDEKLLSAEQGVSDGAQDAAERWAGAGAALSGAVRLAPGAARAVGSAVGRAGRRRGADRASERSGQGGRKGGTGSPVKGGGVA